MQKSTPEIAAPALPRIEDFPIRVPDTIRFADMDRQGHVNNAVYPTYFETGRVPRIYDPKEGLQVEGCTTVLARIEIDFLKELRWPGTVEIGTAHRRDRAKLLRVRAGDLPRGRLRRARALDHGADRSRDPQVAAAAAGAGDAA